MKIKLLALLLSILFILSSCGTSHTHEYTEYLVSNGTHHWFECGCGDKKDVSEHDFDSGVIAIYPTTEREGVRILTCLVCDYEKTEKIDKLAADHVHEFSNVYSSDETHHWYECVCGERKENAQHAFGGGIITTAPTVNSEGVMTYTCSVCRYEKSEVIEKLDPDHTDHEFSYTYSSDEKSHWYQCVCGVKGNLADHNWGDGEVILPAGEFESGIKAFTCSDCGRKVTEVLPAASENGMSFVREAHHKITGRFKENPLSIEAEIKVPKSVNRPGVIFGNYLGIALKHIWQFEILDGGVPRFYYTDASGSAKDITFDGVDVRTGEWLHIAFTFDYNNGVMSLYLDGELVDTKPCEYDLTPDATRYEFVLGGDARSNNGLYFQGQIRSVATYSDVRTAEEIRRSSEKGTNLYADDLLSCYFVNENSRGNDIEDLSGNGYNIPKEWLDSHETTIDYAYSFAVVGDTQWLSKYKPEKMEGIYDWIVENVESKNIAHVFGLGDITEDWNTAGKEQEWIRAYQYISKLNGVVPYSLVRGNHDEEKYFSKYFANDTYMSQFDGFMGGDDITNSYMLVDIGLTKYLFITLDYGASDEMLNWASEIILAHPDRRVIITTHGYMALDETPLHFDNDTQDINSGNDVNTSVGTNIRDYNNGKAMWEEFVSKHPNIFLLLCGHTAFEDIILYRAEGDHGNVVNQICVDAQWMDPQKDGVGMVCMLYFSEDGTQMEIEWLSTDTGKYYKEQNQFVLDLTDSLNAPPHSFETSYNDKYHYKHCECGYTYGDAAHVYDGGVINSDGFIVYSCECGYQKVSSVTDDPTAKELQVLLEKYYNGGNYYKEADVGGVKILTIYGGDNFWVSGSDEKLSVSDYITLKDLVLGRYGNQKLDLGWNNIDGVYSSANADTVSGVASFVSADASGITRVTVEANGGILIIKLYAGSSLAARCEIGSYASTSLVTHEGDILDVIYSKVGADYMCEIITPTISGYVAEYDKIILDSRHNDLTSTVYYSKITVWDGVSVSSSLKGSGTESDPYLIESGADLAYVANEVNKLAAKNSAFIGVYFMMTQSIDLGGHELYIGSYKGWGSRTIFAGFFDGNHCTIRNLNNTRSLFGAVEGGWVKNLSVYGQVSGSDEATGGIVAYTASSGVLENLTSYVTVTGTNTLGGVVGNAENMASTVINCVNYGDVIGSSWNIGGIVGSAGHNITNCVNFGNVHSSGSDNVGGIAGTTKNTGTITGCINYGRISSVHGRVGGIVGWLNKLISDCINYGEIYAGWDSGGVVGFVNEGQAATIMNCINNGNVSGGTGIGGIFGFNHANAGAVLITGCVNNGEVLGTWGVGGIAGNTKAEITDCVNNGTLSATGELGGIVGKCYGKVTECTNNGVVSGAQSIIGGIVGHLHDTTYIDVINSTNYQNGTVEGPTCEQIIGRAE